MARKWAEASYRRTKTVERILFVAGNRTHIQRLFNLYCSHHPDRYNSDFCSQFLFLVSVGRSEGSCNDNRFMERVAERTTTSR